MDTKEYAAALGVKRGLVEDIGTLLRRPRCAARARFLWSGVQALQGEQRNRFRWRDATLQRLLLALRWTVQRERPPRTSHAAGHVEGCTPHRCPDSSVPTGRNLSFCISRSSWPR